MPRVSVRYWPSTLAGGYADQLIVAEELDVMLGDCRRHLPNPDGVIELRCDFDERVQRILRRLPEPFGHPDSLDQDRDRRHRAALKRIASCRDRSWLVIDATTQAPGQVFETTRAWVAALQ
jgi:thymidylate kinase